MNQAWIDFVDMVDQDLQDILKLKYERCVESVKVSKRVVVQINDVEKQIDDILKLLLEKSKAQALTAGIIEEHKEAYVKLQQELRALIVKHCDVSKAFDENDTESVEFIFRQGSADSVKIINWTFSSMIQSLDALTRSSYNSIKSVVWTYKRYVFAIVLFVLLMSKYKSLISVVDQRYLGIMEKLLLPFQLLQSKFGKPKGGSTVNVSEIVTVGPEHTNHFTVLPVLPASVKTYGKQVLGAAAALNYFRSFFKSNPSGSKGSKIKPSTPSMNDDIFKMTPRGVKWDQNMKLNDDIIRLLKNNSVHMTPQEGKNILTFPVNNPKAISIHEIYPDFSRPRQETMGGLVNAIVFTTTLAAVWRMLRKMRFW